jgi:GH15 family glucan-1,4-alpha-glucosidase
MPPTERIDGFAPIEDYAVLGDGRTVALIAVDGRIDWWPFPTLDAPPVCAALLDPDRGGHLVVAPCEPFEVERRYVPGTNVIETLYTTPGGEARVTVALNTGSAGRLPWTELAHRIEGLTGKVPMKVEFVPGNRFGRANPWLTIDHETVIATIGDQTLALITDGTEKPELDEAGVRAGLVAEPGQRAVVAIVGTDHEPVFMPSPAEVDARLDRTIESWRGWTALLELPNEWREPVRRSALALKTLVAEYTGAIAAAATTSLPEGIGGTKNWDYRYAWVRDTSFTLDALINLGLDEEVHGAVSWLLGALRGNDADLPVFFTLEGGLAEHETELDVPGYRHSRPVRAGNSAAGQVQLGTFGDLFDTLERYCGEGHLLDTLTARLLADLADRCCDQWRQQDSGIWELGRREHYTISKIGCWVALDRAARLAERGQLPDRHASRWRAESETIRAWVGRHCWSETKHTYTFYAGTDELDAAVLLAGRTGFDCGPRLVATISAIEAELATGAYVYRYTGAEKEEGAFVACTFWLVEALARTGQADRARSLMGRAVDLANDVGLLAEQADPATGSFLGNIPQGLSHLALINAAFALEGNRADPKEHQHG